jgi:hypothetical protein
VVSGVLLSFRPLPTHCTCAPDPIWDGIPIKSSQLEEAQARLGREQQQGVIAAAKPRRSIGRGENRLDLGARHEVHLSLVVALARYGETCWISELCAGSSKDTNLKKERMTVRRRLRVFALAPRFVSRSVRNAPMNVAPRSGGVRADGDLRNRLVYPAQPSQACTL